MSKSQPLDINALLGQLCTQQHREAIRSLLAGNDAGCFTLRQYAERYHEMHHTTNPEGHREFWIEFLMDVSPRHLRRLGCAEVKLGIWTKEAK